jgi:hypothetical protein
MATRIHARYCVRVLHRVLALLLLISVPGLSTLAKIHWYLPQSNQGHYLTTATKMKVAYAPTVKARFLESVSRLAVSTQPESAAFSEERQDIFVPRMPFTVLLLHRPPPLRIRLV